MKSVLILGLLLATTLTAQTAKAPEPIPVKDSIAVQIRTAQLVESRLQTQQQQLIQEYQKTVTGIQAQENVLLTLEASAFKEAKLSQNDYILNTDTLQFTKKPTPKPETKTTK